MTATDRTTEPAAVFEPLQAAWEAREAVDIAEDVRVEAVAQVLAARLGWHRVVVRGDVARAVAADILHALQPSPVARADDAAAAVERWADQLETEAELIDRIGHQPDVAAAKRDAAAGIRTALEPSR